jgi:hypothetical protein
MSSMFNWSLIAGQSRGFTLMMRPAARVELSTGPDGAEPGAAAATQSDLIAALRFPLAPSWILRRTRRPLESVLPPAVAPRPRGCG